MLVTPLASSQGLQSLPVSLPAGCAAQEEEESLPTAEDDLGASREGSRTDAEAVQR